VQELQVTLHGVLQLQLVLITEEHIGMQQEAVAQQQQVMVVQEQADRVEILVEV
jgi:hypothetical protein